MEKSGLKILFVILMFSLSALAQKRRDIINQLSTYNALYNGIFDGTISFAKLSKSGDFGLGTFNAIDGEMIMLDHIIYQVPADGKVIVIKNKKITSPFAMLTWFDTDKSVVLNSGQTFNDLKKEANSLLPGQNMTYAIRIDGIFQKMKTRSIPKQNKPYPTLTELVKTQPVFEFENIEGTVIGFWTPEFLAGTGLPGFHLHFLTKDRSRGGHILDFMLKEATLKIDDSPYFHLIIPRNEEFQKAEMGMKN
jgi:acetolactate decarboxylase